MSAIRRNQSCAQRVAHQAGYVADAEPVHDLRAMRLDGFDRQIEQKGDFLCAFATRNQAQHLALARSEHLWGRVAAAAVYITFHHLARHGGAEPALPPHHPPQRELELPRRRILQEITRGAGAQRLQYVLLARVHGKNDHAHRREAVAHLRRRLEPRDPLHGDVHQHHIDLFSRSQFERELPARRFAHHGDIRHGVEKRANPSANQGMVVGEQHANRHAAASFFARATGKVATNIVPCPGAERSSSDPDASAMRSSMLTRPRLAPLAARLRTASRSKPRPSSRTERASRLPELYSRTHRFWARAWRSTFVMASWPTRKHAVSVSGSRS